MPTDQAPDHVIDKQLWLRIKRKLHRGSKGGAAQTWSARKSQMLVTEYRKEGGRFRQTKARTVNSSLSTWTSQEWCYSSKKWEGTGRYLPKKVWAQLTPQQRYLTNVNRHKKGRYAPYEDFVLRAFKKAGISMKGS